MYNEVRQCAEVHREVRKYISDWVKPGMKLIDVCETLENSVRTLIQERGMEVSGGRGCSLTAHAIDIDVKGNPRPFRERISVHNAVVPGLSLLLLVGLHLLHSETHHIFC